MSKIDVFFDKYKIRTKMTFIYIVVLIPVFIGSMYLITQMNMNLRENEETESLNNADRIRMRLSDMIQISENVAGMLTSNEDILDFLQSEDLTKPQVFGFYADNQTVKNYLKVFPQLKNVRIFMDKYEFAYNAHYKYADESITSQKWYSETVETGQSSWRVIRDCTDKNQYLSYVTPFKGEDGSVTAVACIEISPDWISEFIYESYYKLVLSLGNGLVFHSDMDGVDIGTVITSAGVDFSETGQRKAMEEGFMGVEGLTVMETFDYSDTGTVFQIFLINPGGKLNEKTNRLTSVYLAYIILLFVISLLLVVLFTSMFSTRIRKLRDRMHSVAKGEFDATLELDGNDEITELNNDLSVMVSGMQLLINEAYQAKLQTEKFRFNQMEAEFKALASQINPHFLYNTLETIRMKAFCNKDKETADLIKVLGKFMRRCFEVKNSNVTLKSELEFTKSYLELQEARFGNRVSYIISNKVDEDYLILPLVIQPIVENAFVHGIESCKENGRIDIFIYYCGEYVYVDVTDNGQGITEEKMAQIREKLTINDTSSGKSIGLTNVNKRIKLYHGDEYGISLKSTEGAGTTVRIMLPRNPGEINGTTD